MSTTATPIGTDRPPLRDAAARFTTALRNDSAEPGELARSISFGAVGATCNPVIALAAIKSRLRRVAAPDRRALP